MKKQIILAIILDLLIIIGFILISLGVGRINFNAGLISAGVSLLIIVLLETLSINKK